MVTGVGGVSMAVYSVIGGEEAGGAALLAASALAFGLLALSLDRTLRFVSGTSEVDRRGYQNGAYRAGDQSDVLQTNGHVTDSRQPAKTTKIDADPITDREREVLALVAEGYSNKLISADLGIAERTVKNHLTTTMTKLRASDRTHAVVTAVRLGWLEI